MSTVYVYGIVNYEDAFEKARYTKFRLTWGDPDRRKVTENGEEFGVLMTEPKGNEAD